MRLLFPTSSLLLLVAASAALAHPSPAIPIPPEKGSVFYDQSVLDSILHLPHAAETVLDIVVDETKRVLHKSLNWVKTLTHPSLPGYSIRVKRTAPLCDPNVVQYTGYLDTATDKHFFFWFFESRDKPKSDPMILWLNGGPGCSSMTGLFSELGPCQVTKGGNATEINKYSWNNNANIIFLDQPLGAGFSYGTEASTTVAAAEDMYAFLQLFYQEFPEYYSADLHITGESYAGHYIPQVAAVIVKENQKSERGETDFATLPLASVAIGNGLTDPLVQYKYYGEYACNNPYGPVVSQEDCNAMTDAYEACARLIKICYKSATALSCLPSSVYCNNKIVQPFQKSGKNVYDVRRKCESNNLCYEIMEWMETYLNKEEVRWELGVGERKFKACNMALNSKFQFAGDWMRPYVRQVPVLLDAGIRVLIYAGDADFICNYMGNKAWTLELEWTGQAEFNAATDEAWPNKEKSFGEIRSYGNFTYLRVYGAGHMVPMDQPEASSLMINRWMDNQL